MESQIDVVADSSAVKIGFNPKPSTVMHLDLNSCFASVEQQANPLLRGKPVAVAAYTTPSGCILAPSREAKVLGVKVGMRVKEAKLICPTLVVVEPDPEKYRAVHRQMSDLLRFYTDKVSPKSIDEFVIDLEGYPAYSRGMKELAVEIKQRIREEIGEWLSVSVGIAPNRFLAKTAASLHKPDGLDEINVQNYLEVYKELRLMDLCGINIRNTVRLNSVGIYTVTDFYQAPVIQLKSAFHSVLGYYWYLRLRGWEIDDVEFGTRSIGHSYALPKPMSSEVELMPIVMKLTEKMVTRMRRHGYGAKGVHLSLLYGDRSYWHKGFDVGQVLLDTREVYKCIRQAYASCPYKKPVRNVAVSVYNLVARQTVQDDLFGWVNKRRKLTAALDEINIKWGEFVLTPARMLGTEGKVVDRIAFGK